MKEIWKEIEISGYFISNFGRLKGRSGKIIKAYLNSEGYYTICLKPNGRSDKSKCVRIHRLVAQAFIPNVDNKPFINHIDGNKQNNIVTNLEWCTNHENMIHASKTGLLKPLQGINNPQAKLTKLDIEYIRNNYIPYNKQYGTRALSKKFGVPHSTITRIIQRKKYKDIK